MPRFFRVSLAQLRQLATQGKFLRNTPRVLQTQSSFNKTIFEGSQKVICGSGSPGFWDGNLEKNLEQWIRNKRPFPWKTQFILSRAGMIGKVAALSAKRMEERCSREKIHKIFCAPEFCFRQGLSSGLTKIPPEHFGFPAKVPEELQDPFLRFKKKQRTEFKLDDFSHAFDLFEFAQDTMVEPKKFIPDIRDPLVFPKVIKPIFDSIDNSLQKHSSSEIRRNLTVIGGTIPFYIYPQPQRETEKQYVLCLNLCPILSYDSNGFLKKIRYVSKNSVAECDYSYEYKTKEGVKTPESFLPLLKKTLNPNTLKFDYKLLRAEPESITSEYAKKFGFEELQKLFLIQTQTKNAPGSPHFTTASGLDMNLLICADYGTGYFAEAEQITPVPFCVIIADRSPLEGEAKIKKNGVLVLCDGDWRDIKSNETPPIFYAFCGDENTSSVSPMMSSIKSETVLIESLIGSLPEEWYLKSFENPFEVPEN